MQLYLQAGGSTRFSEELHSSSVDSPPGIFAAGRINGVYEVSTRVSPRPARGIAGGSPCVIRPCRAAPPSARSHALVPRTSVPHFYHPEARTSSTSTRPAGSRLGKRIQEGFDSSELLSSTARWAWCPSAGKHSNMNALAACSHPRVVRGALGLTTARPMYHPVPIKLLAPQLLPEAAHPLRRAHGSLGAVWMPAGNWANTLYYVRCPARCRAQSIDAEVQAVPAVSAHLCRDVGKIRSSTGLGRFWTPFMPAIFRFESRMTRLR